jgi:hypothetical protein
MGEDRTTLDWGKVVSYFQKLAHSSDRIRVEEIGKSTLGRPFLVATIAAPDTLRHLDRYLDIQRRLADSRLTSDADAETLAAQGKTVVLLTCSIHATEVASTHSAVEMAYRLLTEDTPRFRAILQNVILLLAPSLNPDGVDIVTRWYRKTLGTPFEGTAPPELYHKYVGHDNNRDWYMLSQVETRLTVSRVHNVWHPQIVYDVHQQGPYGSRLFVPPWMDPIEPNIDAILMQEANMIGTAMASDLTAAGKLGISIHSSYDFWAPSRHYQAFHGGLRVLTESASARLSSPIMIAPEQLDPNALGYNARERSWNFLEPWPGGTWRLRDIVEYQLIAMESCLFQAAIHREELLRNSYRVGRRQAARSSPWGFLIRAGQRDPGATRKLLETLAAGMVEVEEAPDGDHVIRMAQPYSGYAKALLERQRYPDLRLYPGGPPRKPYDVTAHTLPLLMGVDVQAIDQAVAGPLARATFQESPTPASFSASDTDTWRTVNGIWSAGAAVWRNMTTGDFSATPRGEGWKRLRQPRIGLYRGYVPSMDEGWTRWLLEQFGFAYTSVSAPLVRRGRLRERLDVLVFPDEPEDAIQNGFREGTMPPEYVGGVGPAGVQALREFAGAGGTLVFLNRSTEYAIERLGVRARNVVRGLPEGEYYSPGSLLNAQVTAGHPLTLGLPARITVWSEHSPAWETSEAALARYPASGLLASGWLLGEKHLANRAALVDANIGQGHVILFGMRPQYRAQSYLTFKLFFNSLLYFN